jgi:hypothetical protein
LLGIRSHQAAKDFNELSAVTNNVPNLPVDNFKTALKTLLDELQLPPDKQALLGGASEQLKKELGGISTAVSKKRTVVETATPEGILTGGPLKIISEKIFGSEKLTAKEFQIVLERFGKAASGTGRIFTDKVDRAESYRVSKYLFGSLKEDLKSAAVDGDEAAEALMRARTNYLANTDKIRDVQNSAVGRLFNRKEGTLTDDDIIKAFSRMGADDTRIAMDILGTADPVIRFRLQKLYLEDIIGKASQPSSFNKINISPGRFFDLQRNDAKFQAVFSTPKEKKMVELGFKMAERIVENFSTSSPSGILPRLKSAAGVAFSMDATFIARLAAEVFAPGAVARAVLTPGGIKALRKMQPPRAITKLPAATASGSISAQEER